jgi:acetolactate synthase-1/2/3 large subunit
LARPEATTVLITGDGSFQLNIQELETLKRNNLNLKIVLFNNSCHGMVRQFQESYFGNNLQSTVTGYSAPAFTHIATAYRLPSIALKQATNSKPSIMHMLDSSGPFLLEVMLPQHSKVYPKLAFGRRFGEMEPEAIPVSMEST